MSAPDDLYASYYDAETISERMDKTFSLASARRVTLPAPDDLWASIPPGLPSYHPSVMPHAAYYGSRAKPAYVAPLAYYVLRALHPYYTAISPLEKLISSQVSVGAERVSIVECLLPYAKRDMCYVDPPTWALLVQIFYSLPERCFKFTLALNDPHLTTLVTIPSTPSFSIVTFLDLSGCRDLCDGNISLLKVLVSLCVFDSSGTSLTDQGVKNFRSTLFLQETGPAYLRSWSLRGCGGVTAKSLMSLLMFPLLCVLDFRGTSIHPSRLQAGFWPRSALLPVLDNVECFAPYPQYRIPALLQRMETACFLHSQNDAEVQEPYVIHIDRMHPDSVSRIPPRRRLDYDRDDNGCSHHDSDSDYGFGYGGEVDDDFWRRESMSPENESQGGYDNLFEDTASSAGESESGDAPALVYRESAPSSPVSSHIVRSSSPPMPDLSTGSPQLQPVASHIDPDISSETDCDKSGIHHNRSCMSPQLPSDLAPTIEILRDTSSLSDDGPSDALDDILERESVNSTLTIPGFFNSRVQAGLAPPKRKLASQDSNDSLSSSDSVDESKRRKLDISSLGEDELLLLRRPPPWSVVKNIIAAKRNPTKPTSQPHCSSDELESPASQPAKTRKIVPGGMMATWNIIKASSSKKPTPPVNQPTLASTASPRIGNTGLVSHIRPLATQPELSQGQNKPIRRTTLGRAPKPPGTIVWKLK